MIKGREDGTHQDYLLSTLEKMPDLKMLKREKEVVRRLMEQEGGGHAGGVGRVHEGDLLDYSGGKLLTSFSTCQNNRVSV